MNKIQFETMLVAVLTAGRVASGATGSTPELFRDLHKALTDAKIIGPHSELRTRARRAQD